MRNMGKPQLVSCAWPGVSGGTRLTHGTEGAHAARERAVRRAFGSWQRTHRCRPEHVQEDGGNTQDGDRDVEPVATAAAVAGNPLRHEGNNDLDNNEERHSAIREYKRPKFNRMPQGIVGLDYHPEQQEGGEGERTAAQDGIAARHLHAVGVDDCALCASHAMACGALDVHRHLGKGVLCFCCREKFAWKFALSVCRVATAGEVVQL